MSEVIADLKGNKRGRELLGGQKRLFGQMNQVLRPEGLEQAIQTETGR